MNPVRLYEYGKSRNIFTSTWKTDNTSAGSSTSTQVKLPLISAGTYNMRVNWGDGNTDTITVYNQAEVTHTYSIAGTYQIRITGTCNGWQFNNTGDRLKILSVQKWGALKPTSSGGCFYGCTNLNLTGVSDVLNTSLIIGWSGFFRNCTSLTTINRIGEWNTSLANSMTDFFNGCTNLNDAGVGLLNTGNVANFANMFNGCITFNQALFYNTSTATSFSSMFQGATAFNNGGNTSITFWVTNNITNMSNTFNSTNFNMPLNWNTGNVVTFAQMFSNAPLFNQNIGGFIVTKATSFSAMFINATAFNNGGSNSINTWVINTTSNVSMAQMFQNSTGFNQPIGNWDIRNVNNFTSFMLGKTPATYSTTNLDLIYNGWSTRPVVAGIAITFGTAKYTAGSSAGRAILTGAPNNWVITDGGI